MVVKKKNKDRQFLSMCVGKIMSFYLIGRVDEARQWATQLAERLKKMELL